MNPYPSSRTASQTRTGERSDTDTPFNPAGDRFAIRHPPTFPEYLRHSGIAPAETKRLLKIIQRLVGSCISRNRRMSLIEPATQNTHTGSSSIASTSGSAQDSSGQGGTTGLEPDSRPSRKQLDALLGYEMVYFDIFKLMPSDLPDSIPPSRNDAITRLVYLESMIEHYTALDWRFVSTTCRSVPDKSVFREALKCMWAIVQEGDKDALEMLNFILMKS